MKTNLFLHIINTEVYFQTLFDKDCFCGGILKIFEMLSTIKKLLCLDDQGRESRLIFAELPWAPAQAPTIAPTTTGPTTVSATASQDCKCGVPSANRNKIVGGQAANKVVDHLFIKLRLEQCHIFQNEYPWQVALISNGGSAPFCGGTIISDDTILTAAHCAADVSLFKSGSDCFQKDPVDYL